MLVISDSYSFIATKLILSFDFLKVWLRKGFFTASQDVNIGGSPDVCDSGAPGGAAPGREAGAGHNVQPGPGLQVLRRERRDPLRPGQ